MWLVFNQLMRFFIDSVQILIFTYQQFTACLNDMDVVFEVDYLRLVQNAIESIDGRVVDANAIDTNEPQIGVTIFIHGKHITVWQTMRIAIFITVDPELVAIIAINT